MDKEKANQHPEDDGDEEVPEVEDEAPEAVQAIPASSPWATFPDLLASNQTSQSVCAEDEDAPESQLSFSMRLNRAVVQNLGQSNGSNHQHAASSSASSSAASGAIPKIRPSMGPPPDISLAASSSAAASGSTMPKQADLIPSTSSPSNSAVAGSQPGERVHLLEREVVSLQTQRAVLQQQLNQRDNQLRDLQQQPRPQNVPESITNILSTVANSVASIQVSMDTMARDLTDRLDRLEARLNALTVVDNQSNHVSVDGASAIREELNQLRAQQRQDVENERNVFMLTLADAFRRATDPSKVASKTDATNHHHNNTPDHNGE